MELPVAEKSHLSISPNKIVSSDDKPYFFLVKEMPPYTITLSPPNGVCRWRRGFGNIFFGLPYKLKSDAQSTNVFIIQ